MGSKCINLNAQKYWFHINAFIHISHALKFSYTALTVLVPFSYYSSTSFFFFLFRCLCFGVLLFISWLWIEIPFQSISQNFLKTLLSHNCVVVSPILLKFMRYFSRKKRNKFGLRFSFLKYLEINCYEIKLNRVWFRIFKLRNHVSLFSIRDRGESSKYLTHNDNGVSVTNNGNGVGLRLIRFTLDAKILIIFQRYRESRSA